MKTKIIVSVLASGVCLFLGSFALASSYVGIWKGKSKVVETTCPNVYQNGVTEKLAVKIKEIDADGKIKANMRYYGSDDKYKLAGRIKGNNIKFHYVMWGDVKTYDLRGSIEGDLMKLRAYNDRSGTCDGGYYLKLKLGKQ